MTSGRRLRRTWRNVEGRVQRLLLRDGPDRDLPVVIVAGVPRSGTTWVGEVVAAATRSRLLFEPLAPVAVGTRTDIPTFPYRRPEDDDPLLEAYMATVLDGSRRDPWIDARPMTSRPRGRVVKMVRSCLMLGWLAARFPRIPIVFVTRDAWSVVRSRLRMQWDPRPDLAALVAQPELMRRLDERQCGGMVRAVDEELRGATSGPDVKGKPGIDQRLDIEANAVLWAVHTAVAREDLRDLPALHLAYAALRARPEQEFERVIERLSARASFRLAPESTIRRAAGRASATSAGARPSSGRAQFVEEFGSGSAERIASIAESFGLDRSDTAER